MFGATAVTTTKSNVAKRKTAVVATSRKAPPSKPLHKVPATVVSRKAPKVTRHTRSQLTPTPERYKEIQQALASKGYLRTEPTGEWSSDSAEALKRFQAEQNLSPDGKLTSLSLIALGLGPKRLSPQAAAPVEVESPRADPPK